MKFCVIILCQIVVLMGVAKDLSWTFPWDGQQVGLCFENENIPAATKQTIRDDVALIYSQIPATNMTWFVYPSGHGSYGNHTGMVLRNEDARISFPRGFDCFQYDVFNTTNYLFLTQDTIANYQAKIAITNTHYSGIVKLTPFLQTADNLSSTTTTPAAFLNMWWSVATHRALTLADEDDPDPEYIKTLINNQGTYHYSAVSILDYSYESINGENYLICRRVLYKKNDQQQRIDMCFIYADGGWHFLAFE